MKVAPDILARCKQNDRLAQEKLYADIYPDVMRIVLRYVYNDLDAQSILNAALLKVFTKTSDFKGDSTNYGGWIRRIVINEALDFLRKKKAFTEKHRLTEDYSDGLSDGVSLEEDPNQILNLLKSLPTLSATVFNLYIIEGYSHKEIAEIAGITEGNSKWNLHHARKLLQKLVVENDLL